MHTNIYIYILIYIHSNICIYIHICTHTIKYLAASQEQIRQYSAQQTGHIYYICTNLQIYIFTPLYKTHKNICIHVHTNRIEFLAARQERNQRYSAQQTGHIYIYIHTFIYTHTYIFTQMYLHCCVRCLLITESPKTSHHYRYQI